MRPGSTGTQTVESQQAGPPLGGAQVGGSVAPGYPVGTFAPQAAAASSSSNASGYDPRVFLTMMAAMMAGGGGGESDARVVVTQLPF